MTANDSSSSPPGLTEVDLTAEGLLAPLPAAFLGGRQRQLLDPLTYHDGEAGATGIVPAASAALPDLDRGPLARALAAANSSYGHPAADRLARKLADPATRVVVTGQQPGLFGGPLYTLSKAVAAARWAAALEAAGQPAVAVFWVATEDHDYAEVANATLPTRQGPRTFRLAEEDPEPLAPVGTRALGPAVSEALGEIAGLPSAGDRYEEWWGTVGRWYRPDARFGEAFCRLLVELLGERCPLLLDSMLPEVKQAELPWLRRLIERREAVEEAGAAAAERIEAAGFPLQVTPQPGAPPLFLLAGRQRRRIEWQGADRWRLRGDKETGGTVDELLERIADNPILLSPGALARPAIQDAMLGTTLQILGPGELSYMPQAAALYPVLELPGPATTLRPQALVLEGHQEEKLAATGVRLATLLGDEESLDRRLAEERGEDPVPAIEERIAAALDELKARALAIDQNLERPWQKTRDQMMRALSTFSGKLIAAAARSDEVTRRRIDRLRDDLLPGGKLQERLIASAHYPGKYGERFVEALFEQLELDPRRLQIIRI